MTTSSQLRLPTVQELSNSMVRMLCAYHLLLEGKKQVKELDESNIPEVSSGLIGMTYTILIGTLIESDPLLSQCKEEVYNMLAKMINTESASTTKSKDGE